MAEAEGASSVDFRTENGFPATENVGQRIGHDLEQLRERTTQTVTSLPANPNLLLLIETPVQHIHIFCTASAIMT